MGDSPVHVTMDSAVMATHVLMRTNAKVLTAVTLMPPVQISRVLILVLAIMVSAATDTHAPMLMNALMDLTTVQTTPVVPIILVVLNVMQ